MNRALVCVLVLVAMLGVPALASAADFTVTMGGQSRYIINGASNPTLTLTRGKTYTFELNAPDHPLLIKTVQETGWSNTYDDGVVNQGVSIGTLTFTVPMSAPSLLFYQCEFHDVMTGRLVIESAAPVPATTNVTRIVLAIGLGAAGFFVLRARKLGESHRLRTRAHM